MSAPDLAEERGLEGRALLALAGVCLALLAIGYAAPVAWMVERWSAPNSHYSHGPLVPLIVLWLLWRERARVFGLLGSSAWGLLPLGLAAYATAVGSVEESFVLQLLALLLALGGLGLVCLGGEALRGGWFPLVYAGLFMIPASGMVLDRVTGGLKLFSARCAHVALEVLGLVVVRQGAMLRLAGGKGVVVDELCSGLRSLVSVLAIAAALAYLHPSRARALVLLGLACPLAVLGNVLRVLALTGASLLGLDIGPDTTLHQGTGVVSFLVCLACLSWVAGDLSPAEGGVAPPPPARVRGPSRALAALTLLLVLACAGAAWRRVGRPVAEQTVIASIPRRIGAWEAEVAPLSSREQRLLGDTDYALLRWRRAGTSVPLELYVLVAPGGELHPPDGCYGMQGFRELQRGRITLDLGAEQVAANRTLIELGGQQQLLYFWYRLPDGTRTCTLHELELDLRLDGLLRRSLLIEQRLMSTYRMSAPVGQGGVEASDAALRAFVAEAWPAIAQSLGGR